MRIVRRYLFNTIVVHAGLVLGVLLSLGMFIEMAGQLDDVGTGNYGIAQMMAFILLKMPGLAFMMLPMAVLLGSLVGLGSLASHSELIALRSAGVSTLRFAGAIMMTGAVLAVVGAILGEYVSPPLDSYARQYRSMAKRGQSGFVSTRATWIRDRNVILNINPLNRSGQFGGVYIFRLAPENRLDSVGHADSAGVDDDDQLVLSNYRETRFTDQGVSTYRAFRSRQPNNLDPDLLGMTVVSPKTLDGVALYRYVQYLKSNGLNAHRFEVAFWSRIASVVAIVPMCVLALPFVFGSLRSSGTGARMLVGIMIGLSYYLVSRSLANGGQVYDLNAVWVAWMPTIILTVITALALRRAR